jgi:hypothetical protein
MYACLVVSVYTAPVRPIVKVVYAVMIADVPLGLQQEQK